MSDEKVFATKVKGKTMECMTRQRKDSQGYQFVDKKHCLKWLAQKFCKPSGYKAIVMKDHKVVGEILP